MPSAIIRGATGQPGPIAYPSGITTGIFNELNFVIPDYIPGLIAKYGNSDFPFMMEILGRSCVENVNTTTNTFSHFEKGRPFGSGLVAGDVESTVAGDAINITLKSPESYNNGATGTQSPFMLKQVVKIRSNGRKFRVTNITRTTGAFVIEATPLGNYTLITGSTGTTLKAGEGLETFGNQLAGESSDSQGTMQQKMYRYDNTATVLRASTKSSDLAGMNKTQVDFGGGNFYEPALAIQTMNVNMMMDIQDAVMEGVPYANTDDTGTVGVLPAVEARGSEINYVQYAFAIGDFQNLTNVIDANGGPREYHFLQDLKQRQDINNLLFGIYKNGAISYGSVGMSAEAAASYGFKGFSTDTYDFFFNRYKGFGAEATFGYTPTQGDYRSFFGLAVPQGKVMDAKDGTSRPQLQFVYQQNPDITAGQRIYSWDLGYTKATKTTIAENKYEQIAYVGSRVLAAEQFVILRGVTS
ncbi:MAG: hypothetical protein KBD79_13450 [Chitinophagales bacterium]|nr:hypothetical protein [Chitinophagales bacterium]